MKFCHECGSELFKGAKFCPECGTPLVNTHHSKSSQLSTIEEASNELDNEDRKTVMRDGMVYGVVDLNNLPEGHEIEERYEIKRKIGQGGFGAVYLAFDKKMNIEKALKVIPESVSNDIRAMDTLKEEARTMLKLKHPNIVGFYDFHDKGTIKFIDMEYIDGKSINEILHETEGGKLEEKEVKEYAKQILEGLGYAHNQRVIHRDIKPQNIMLTKSGQIKIMDFGIAETLRNSVSRLENSTSSGTLVYMSPEQIRGKDVGRESDIYSLGATLYEMLSGNPPFYKGDINYQILNERPERISHITDEMNEVLQKCLMKDREERYKTCNDMKDGIEGRFVEREIGQETQAEVKAKSSYSKQSRDTEVKEKSSNKSKISIITSVVIIILAIISYWYFQGNNSSIELAENNAINIDDMKDSNWDKLSRLEQQRIEELIKQGDKQFISSKLVKPKGDNAYETYNEVLKLHKGNKYAIAQLDLIRKDFIRRAELEEESKNLQAAVTILENGLIYYKNNNELKERAKKNKVEILLEKANTQYDANNLTGAEELTTEILAIETDNKRATELQDKIIESYKTEGEKANKSKNYRTALTYYEKINNIEPNSEEIAVKIKEIKDKIGQAELARKAEGKRIAEEQRQQEALNKKYNLVFVKGGTFQMGSNNGSYDEKPVHNVTVGNFYIGKYEVTFAEYDVFCEATGRKKPSDNGWGRGKHPVINVSWHDAVAYCKWLSKETGKKFRLPTEAEWEYAAKGGNRSKGYKYSGSNSIGNVAWYLNNSGQKTHTVGQKGSNELGIYDMSGNVWEWCNDWYRSSYYSSSPSVDPKGPSSGMNRVLRGGSWDHFDDGCRSAFRGSRVNPGSARGDNGFRCVQDK